MERLDWLEPENTHRKWNITVQLVSSLTGTESGALLHASKNIFSCLIDYNPVQLETSRTVNPTEVSGYSLLNNYNKPASVVAQWYLDHPSISRMRFESRQQSILTLSMEKIFHLQFKVCSLLLYKVVRINNMNVIDLFQGTNWLYHLETIMKI